MPRERAYSMCRTRRGSSDSDLQEACRTSGRIATTSPTATVQVIAPDSPASPRRAIAETEARERTCLAPARLRFTVEEGSLSAAESSARENTLETIP